MSAEIQAINNVKERDGKSIMHKNHERLLRCSESNQRMNKKKKTALDRSCDAQNVCVVQTRYNDE